jgi:exodeoxyribonuclease VII small subunit
MSTSKKAFQLEQSLQELEGLVQQMESGDLSLEESLKSFEKGIKITRSCQQALDSAQRKVQVLIEKNASSELKDFDGNSPESNA